MQLDGKIIAPTSSNAWGSGLLQWLEFKNLKGITVKGAGIIDGQGSVWWNDLAKYLPTDDSVRGLNNTTFIFINEPFSLIFGPKPVMHSH